MVRGGPRTVGPIEPVGAPPVGPGQWSGQEGEFNHSSKALLASYQTQDCILTWSRWNKSFELPTCRNVLVVWLLCRLADQRTKWRASCLITREMINNYWGDRLAELQINTTGFQVTCSMVLQIEHKWLNCALCCDVDENSCGFSSWKLCDMTFKTILEHLALKSKRWTFKCWNDSHWEFLKSKRLKQCGWIWKSGRKYAKTPLWQTIFFTCVAFSTDIKCNGLNCYHKNS